MAKAEVKNILIVSDLLKSEIILDTSRRRFKENYPDLNIKFAVVYTKKPCLGIVDYYSEVVDERWLVFPYEKN